MFPIVSNFDMLFRSSARCHIFVSAIMVFSRSQFMTSCKAQKCGILRSSEKACQSWRKLVQRSKEIRLSPLRGSIFIHCHGKSVTFCDIIYECSQLSPTLTCFFGAPQNATFL